MEVYSSNKFITINEYTEISKVMEEYICGAE